MRQEKGQPPRPPFFHFQLSDSVFDDFHAEGVALADLLDEVEAFRHLAKTRVVAVEVCGVLTVVDDEKLRAACVSACVGHAQHALVVVLVLPIELAVDGVPRSTASNALRAPTLGHKPWDHAVKLQSLVKALFGELHKVRDRVGRVLLKKLHGHAAVVGVNLGVHAAKMHHLPKPTAISIPRQPQVLRCTALNLPERSHNVVSCSVLIKRHD